MPLLYGVLYLISYDHKGDIQKYFKDYVHMSLLYTIYHNSKLDGAKHSVVIRYRKALDSGTGSRISDIQSMGGQIIMGYIIKITDTTFEK